MKEQRYMDSASNSMTPRPQAVRSSSEYHSQASSLYHPGNSTPMRRHSSNPAELGSTQPLRRVEGTVMISGSRCNSCAYLLLPLIINAWCCSLAAASSTTGPEAAASDRESQQLPSKNPSSWTIEEVMQFVRDADPTALAPHAELFRKHVSSLNITTWFSLHLCTGNSQWQGALVQTLTQTQRWTDLWSKLKHQRHSDLTRPYLKNAWREHVSVSEDLCQIWTVKFMASWIWYIKCILR